MIFKVPHGLIILQKIKQWYFIRKKAVKIKWLDGISCILIAYDNNHQSGILEFESRIDSIIFIIKPTNK